MPHGFSVFPRSGRPVWYAKFVSAETLDWLSVATPFRLDDPAGKRKAIHFAESKAREYARTGLARRKEGWSVWVQSFLENRYRVPTTLKRYLGAWAKWIEFLTEEKISAPAQLNYNHVLRFVAWREGQERPNGNRISRNTALCDVKLMSVVMREAIRRGFALANPCERLELRRDPAKEKKELTRDEIATIRAAVAAREAHLPIAQRWMTVCFEIALHQGCRLRETEVPLHLIDEARQQITFFGKGRGGQKKEIPTLLHPALLPLVAELRAAKATHTCRLPRMAAKLWWDLRRELHLEHTCFHSTRVTVITEMARQRVPEQQAMRFVGHSSRLVHRIYQKLRPDDLSACAAALDFSPSAATGAKARSADAPASTRGSSTDSSHSDRGTGNQAGPA